MSFLGLYMKTCRNAFVGILSVLLMVAVLGCGSGSEAVDTTGLNQVTLRIEGMT